MPSKTLAARESADSRAVMSTSRLWRMASGSAPSMTIIRPLRRKSSLTPSTSVSSPSSPVRLAVLAHSTKLAMRSSTSAVGGLNTQGNIAKARRMVAIGVWIMTAAMVPTTTIMNAALDTSACRPAPLSTAPTSTDTRANTIPSRLRISMRGLTRRLAQVGYIVAGFLSPAG